MPGPVRRSFLAEYSVGRRGKHDRYAYAWYQNFNNGNQNNNNRNNELRARAVRRLVIE